MLLVRSPKHQSESVREDGGGEIFRARRRRRRRARARGLNVKPRRSVDRGAFSDEPRASIDIDRDEVLCEDRKRALDDLDGGHEHDSHDRALETEESEPGTEEDHRAAEVVAIKTASAAMKRIESGVNMTGMVRMDGANALAAVGMGSDKLASDFMLHASRVVRAC